MKKTKRLMMVLMAVFTLSMVLTGCEKKPVNVGEGNEVGTQATVEVPVATKEPEESKEVEPTAEPVLEATATPKVTEEPVATKEPDAEPTQAPTAAPTAEPTEAPKATPAPTKVPEPTKAPEQKPTQAPTAAPTQAPPKVTEAPVATPVPTQAPTQAPVVEHTHSYDGGTITTQPTCGTDGVKTYSCACGHSYTESVPATGNHTIYTHYVSYPTCTKTGYVNYMCSVCGIYTGDEMLDFLPHEYESTVKFSGNCTTPRSWYNTCKVCGGQGPVTYGDVNPDVHDWYTVTGEVWDEENWVWYEVTRTYCGDCGATQ